MVDIKNDLSDVEVVDATEILESVEAVEVVEEGGLDALRGMNARLQEEVISMVTRKEQEAAVREMPEYGKYPLEMRRAGVVEVLTTLLGLEPEDVPFSKPPSEVDADFAIPIFKIWARTPGQDNNGLLAAFDDFLSVIVDYANDELPFKVNFERNGIFLNVKFDKANLARDIVGCVEEMGGSFGDSDFMKGEKVVVDFSSPNTAKTMHMGHLRGTIIGQVLMNLLDKTGATAYGINHLGDWGTQFGQLVTAYKMWGSDVAAEIDREKEPVKFLATLYTKMKQAILAEKGTTEEEEVARKAEAKERRKLKHEGHTMDESEDVTVTEFEGPTPLADEGRANFARLEAGDPEVVALWDEFRRLSLIEFDRIYKRLDITFDKVLGESFYEDKMPEPIAQAKEQGLAQLAEDGSWMLKFSEESGVPPAMLLKPDGGTLYLTRDVAAIRHRMRNFNASKVWYVIGTEQKIHMRQIFETARQLGDTEGDECRHVANGLMKMSGRKIASREGAGGLEDFLDSLKESAKKLLLSKSDEWEDGELEETSEVLAMGAIIYANFAKDIEKDMNFDPEQMLDLASQTGAYLQYTAVRLNSLLAKLGDVNGHELSDEMIEGFLPEVHMVLGTVGKFPEVVATTTERSAPHILASYLFDLATQFNRLYSVSKREGARFMDMDPAEKAAYAKVFSTVVVTLTKGLELLHIKVPSKM